MENIHATLVVTGSKNPGQHVQSLVELGNRLSPQQIEAVLSQLVTATLGHVSTTPPLGGLQVPGVQTPEERAALEAGADTTLGPVTAQALFQPKAMDALDQPKAMDALDELCAAVLNGTLNTEALLDILLVHKTQDATSPHQDDGTSSEVDPQVRQFLQDIIAQLELLRNQNESQPSSACRTPRSMFGPEEKERSTVHQARALRDRLNAALQGYEITAEVIVNDGASPDQWELKLHVGTEEQANQLAATLTSQYYSSVSVQVETDSEPDISSTSGDTSSPANGSSNNRSGASTPSARPEPTIPLADAHYPSDNHENAGDKPMIVLIGVRRGDARKHNQDGLNGNTEANQVIAQIIARELNLPYQTAMGVVSNTVTLNHTESQIGRFNNPLFDCFSPRKMEPQHTPASQRNAAAASLQAGWQSSPRSSQSSNSHERCGMGPFEIRIK